jgi:hypothetical protein
MKMVTVTIFATGLVAASAAAFAGYLQPAMLVQFANLLLCG